MAQRPQRHACWSRSWGGQRAGVSTVNTTTAVSSIDSLGAAASRSAIQLSSASAGGHSPRRPPRVPGRRRPASTSPGRRRRAVRRCRGRRRHRPGASRHSSARRRPDARRSGHPSGSPTGRSRYCAAPSATTIGAGWPASRTVICRPSIAMSQTVAQRGLVRPRRRAAGPGRAGSVRPACRRAAVCARRRAGAPQRRLVRAVPHHVPDDGADRARPGSRRRRRSRHRARRRRARGGSRSRTDAAPVSSSGVGSSPRSSRACSAALSSASRAAAAAWPAPACARWRSGSSARATRR